VDIHDFGSTYKAYRREVIHNIPLYGRCTAYPGAGLVVWASICEIPISNRAANMGKATMAVAHSRGVLRSADHPFLLRYMTRPLHFFGLIGTLGIFAGGALSTWLLVLKVMTGSR